MLAILEQYFTHFIYESCLVYETLGLPEIDAMDLLGWIFSPICSATAIKNEETEFCGKLAASSLIFGNLISFQILAEGRSFREDGHPKCDCDAKTQWPSEQTELIITSLLLGSYFIGQAFVTKKHENRKERRSAFFMAITAVFLRTNLISLMVRYCPKKIDSFFLVCSIRLVYVGRGKFSNCKLQLFCSRRV